MGERRSESNHDDFQKVRQICIALVGLMRAFSWPEPFGSRDGPPHAARAYPCPARAKTVAEEAAQERVARADERGHRRAGRELKEEAELDKPFNNLEVAVEAEMNQLLR